MKRIYAVGLSVAFAVIAAGLFAWQYFGWFQPKISAVSDVPGISLKLVKPERLSEQLNVWGFWEEEGVLLWGEEKLVTVKRLVVHLTDKEQQYYQFTDNEGKVISGTGEHFDRNGTYHLYVFIPAETLQNAPAENLPVAFEAYTLRPLLIASIDDPTLPEKARADIIQGRLGFVNDIMSREERLFKVERK